MEIKLYNGETTTLEMLAVDDVECRYEDGFRTQIWGNWLIIKPIIDSEESVELLNGKDTEIWWIKTQQEYRKYIVKNNVKNILVSNMKSLDFIAGLDCIERVKAFSCYDYSALYSLKNLKSLEYNYGKSID